MRRYHLDVRLVLAVCDLLYQCSCNFPKDHPYMRSIVPTGHMGPHRQNKYYRLTYLYTLVEGIRNGCKRLLCHLHHYYTPGI